MTIDSGEREWFEVKAGMHPQQEIKFSKVICGMANAGGGVIYYGWDENSNHPTQINIDDIQGKILPHTKNCEPIIPIEFHPLKYDNITGLFVGVPAMEIPVQHKNGKFYHRKGSHNTSMDDNESIKLSEIHLRKGQSGHLYLKSISKKLKSIYPDYFKRKLGKSRKFFEMIKSELVKDLHDNWKIRFKYWLSERPEFPVRISYDGWYSPASDSISQKFIVNINEEISKLQFLISEIQSYFPEIDNSELSQLIRDTSKNDTKQPTNHQRCLTTLIYSQIKHDLFNITLGQFIFVMLNIRWYNIINIRDAQKEISKSLEQKRQLK